MANSRRAQVLAATLIVAIIGLIVVRSMGDSSSAPSPTTPAARDGRTPPVAAGLVAPHVNLAALTRARGEPTSQGRDPFRFRSTPAPSVPSGDTRDSANPFGGGGNPAVPVVPTGPPPPPPITLKFIGLVEKADGTKIAVLSDGRGPIHGVEGQEIEGRYKILKIGAESIEIAYLDGGGRQTIRLTGQ